MLALVGAFSAQSSANRNSLPITVFTLVFAWSILRLKTEPSVRYWIFDSIIQTTKGIKQHRRKHDTKKNVGQDTSLLNPICDGKDYRAFSVVLHPCMHAVMKLSNDGDEFFGATIFCQDSPKAVSADYVKYLGQININREEVSVLFLTLLLQLPRC